MNSGNQSVSIAGNNLQVTSAVNLDTWLNFLITVTKGQNHTINVPL
jgi:hypothetical protein